MLWKRKIHQKFVLFNWDILHQGNLSEWTIEQKSPFSSSNSLQSIIIPTASSPTYIRYFLWSIESIPGQTSPKSQKYHFIWIIWFLIGNLHQSLCKLKYENLKNLWKRKIHKILKSFIVTPTLGPLSGYHNLIWKQCTTFHCIALVFLSHRILIYNW